MFDLQIASVKSSEIVLFLTVANVSMGGSVSLFKTSAVDLIKIEVTVYGYVAYWNIAPTTDVLQRKSFEAMGAAVLEDNYGQIPFCYNKCMWKIRVVSELFKRCCSFCSYFFPRWSMKNKVKTPCILLQGEQTKTN